MVRMVCAFCCVGTSVYTYVDKMVLRHHRHRWHERPMERYHLGPDRPRHQPERDHHGYRWQHQRPHCEVNAVDASEDALQVAQANAQLPSKLYAVPDPLWSVELSAFLPGFL